MQQTALILLNRILDAAAPDATVCLPPFQATILGHLDARELGYDLKARMAETSVEKALEMHGLFGRQIRVVRSQADFTVK